VATTDVLDDIEWLALCTTRERMWIRRHADVIDVAAGSVVLHEGDASRWFYAVIEGDALATVDGVLVARLGAGDPLNDLELLRNEPAAATVTAKTDLRLLVMGRREFMGMLDEIPGLARRVLLPRIPAPPAVRRRRAALVPLPAA
jgi:CRP-like cAMP-binding protein